MSRTKANISIMYSNVFLSFLNSFSPSFDISLFSWFLYFLKLPNICSLVLFPISPISFFLTSRFPFSLFLQIFYQFFTVTSLFPCIPHTLITKFPFSISVSLVSPYPFSQFNQSCLLLLSRISISPNISSSQFPLFSTSIFYYFPFPLFP